jgi:chain length determinant protein (polysaccharide antigen chain regulator)
MTEPQKTRELDILDLLAVIWRGKWLIALVTIVAVAAALLVGLFVTTPIYEDEAVLQLTAGKNYGRSVAVGRLIRSGEFVEAVLPRVKGFSEAEVREVADSLLSDTVVTFETLVGAQPIVAFEVVELRIKGADPELIHAWISAVVAELQERSDQHYRERAEIREGYLTSLRNQISLLDDMIDETRAAIDNVDPQDSELIYSLVTRLDMQLERREKAVADEYETALDAHEDQPFMVLQAPMLPTQPVNISLAMNVAVALFLGLFAGTTLVILQDYFKALTHKS